MATPPPEPLPYATPLPPGQRSMRRLIAILLTALTFCLIALAVLVWILASGTRVNLTTTVVRAPAPPPPQAPPPPLAMPSHPVEITLHQRRSEPIPGSAGSAVIAIDDITAGQVLVTITRPNGQPILPTTSLAHGHSAPFRAAGTDYHITAKHLRNFLIGDDFGVFTIAPGPAPPPPPPAPAATAPSTLPTTAPATQPAAIPGVSNFAQVSPILYRGAQPTAEGFAELKKRGIKTVVNLRTFHSDRDELQGLGLRYVHVPCQAWQPDDADMVRILKVLEDPANHPVFIHCQHGADRTGAAVAVYRVLRDGWTMEQAVEEMHAFGFHPIWTHIKDYLARFDPEQMRSAVANAPEVKVETIP